MLGDAATIEAVCDVLEAKARGVPLVVDPVMVAKGGAELLAGTALRAPQDPLLPLAALITPNLPEAEALSGHGDRPTKPRCARAAAALLGAGRAGGAAEGRASAGGGGGRCAGDRGGIGGIPRAAAWPRGTRMAPAAPWPALSRRGWRRGWRCTPAVARAIAYVRAAIGAAPGFGGGHGPLNHAVTVDPARLEGLG